MSSDLCRDFVSKYSKRYEFSRFPPRLREDIAALALTRYSESRQAHLFETIVGWSMIAATILGVIIGGVGYSHWGIIGVCLWGAFCIFANCILLAVYSKLLGKRWLRCFLQSEEAKRLINENTDGNQ